MRTLVGLVSIALLGAGCVEAGRGKVQDDTACAPGSWYADDDGDGFGAAGSTPIEGCAAPADHVADASDCDDADPSSNPDGAEVCGGGDEDCDGLVDDADPDVTGRTTWYADQDGDGFGDADASTEACAGGGSWVADSTDCDDASAATRPDGQEVCGGADEDCDGLADDADPSLDPSSATTWYADADEDGVGASASARDACVVPDRHVANAGDCNDDDAFVTDTRGAVTFVRANGVVQDLSSTFGGTADAPAEWVASEDGELRVCPGTWYTRLTIADADVDVVGYGGSGLDGDIQLHANRTGRVVEVTGGASARTVTLRNLYLTGGVDPTLGGGLYLAGYLTVNTDAVAIVGNSVGSYGAGGGFGVASGGTLRMVDSVVTGNDSWHGGGGAMQDGAEAFEAVGSSFDGNLASTYGGGLFVRDGAFTLTDCSVSDNQGSYGGGLALEVGGTFTGVEIARNEALDGGGMIVTYISDSIVVTDSEIVSNFAAGSGGGMYLHGSVFELDGSAVRDNSAAEGAGVYLGGYGQVTSSLTCVGDSTVEAGVWGNTASVVGGGAYVGTSGGAYAASLESDGCDWTGDANNSPEDVYASPDGASGYTANYGDDATFSCSAFTGCVP